MKILLLAGDQPNQHALAQKVAKEHNLVGIVYERKKNTQSKSFKRFLSKIVDRILFFKIAGSWNNMLNYYQNKFPDKYTNNCIFASEINSNDVLNFIIEKQPDLIMVSGTRLIKEPILNLAIPKGIINLHTGLSPYVKGGPNCTNWCISNNTPHLIGNTIMWIDKGIDSGNIIASEKVKFLGNESINEIHIKVMEHAHQLYLTALNYLKNEPNTYQSIPQTQIAKGKLYLSNMWGFNAKFRFMYNLSTGKLNRKIKDPSYKNDFDTTKAIELP